MNIGFHPYFYRNTKIPTTGQYRFSPSCLRNTTPLSFSPPPDSDSRQRTPDLSRSEGKPYRRLLSSRQRMTPRTRPGHPSRPHRTSGRGTVTGRSTSPLRVLTHDTDSDVSTGPPHVERTVYTPRRDWTLGPRPGDLLEKSRHIGVGGGFQEHHRYPPQEYTD